MAGNTQRLVKDADMKPAPQYYNPTADAYEYLFGRNGANRVELYGPDGSPISVTSGRLDVRASELDITLSALRDALRGIDGKTISDLATLLTAIKDTQGIKKITDTVGADVVDRAARVLGKITADDNAIATLGALADAAVTNPAALASVIALLKGLLKQLQGTGSGSQPVNLSAALPAGDNLVGRVKLSDGTDLAAINADGSVLVDVTDRSARVLGKIAADDNAIAALGALAEAAVTNPTVAASVIALLKGLLKQLQGTGTGAAPVQLTGSYATIDSAPVVGAKTVTTTAAELFAGASRLANRYAMIVYNESSVPVYWGPSGVTAATGFPLLPQDSVVFQFNSSVATAIYFIAASNAAVRVVELA